MTKNRRISYVVFVLPLLSSCGSLGNIAVPDYVDSGLKSPWNFTEDFEDQDPGRLRLSPLLSINDKGMGSKPFRVEREPDGNQYLAITVEDGWNTDPTNKKLGGTERAEIETKHRYAREREIWYGFRLRFPRNFTHIPDRLLISQFKNQFRNMRKSPLVGIRFYARGNQLSIGGDTGGIATKSYNVDEYREHGIRADYLQYETIWRPFSTKNRGEDSRNRLETENAPVTGMGEWVTFKVGVRNSSSEDGFVKVYKDGQLFYDYQGVTFDWSGRYTGSTVRIGIYRDGDPTGDGYPSQTVHYDDFTVVSDKKTLDEILMD